MARATLSTGETLLTPKQAAALVGVSESTVRRWCDERRLPAARTGGKHRRIAQGVLLAYARRAGFGSTDGHPVTVAGNGGRAAAPAQIEARLVDALLGPNELGVRTLVAGWMERGGAPEVLFDAVIAPAMHVVGERWAAGRLAVFEEHRATQLVYDALALLPQYLPAPPRDAPVAICAALSGDPYGIAPRMAALVLQAERFRPMLLGPDTPVDEVARAAHESGASLACVSLGATGAPHLERDIEALAVLAETGVGVVVGGRGWSAPMAGAAGAVQHGETMADLRRIAHARRAAVRTRSRRSGAPRMGREEQST